MSGSNERGPSKKAILAPSPVLVYGQESIPWSTFQQALEYFRGDTESIIPGLLLPCVKEYYYPSIYDTAEPWLALSDTWTTLPRPTHWNGRCLRNLSSLSSETKLSVADLRLNYSKPYEIWRASLIASGIVLSLFTCLPLIFGLNLLRIYNQIAAIVFLSIPVSAWIMYSVAVIVWLHAGPGGIGENCGLSSTEAPITAILRALRERGATDPKDKAFAIHGVLRTLGVAPPDATYSKSVGSVYHELFLALLRWQPNLINLLADVDLQLTVSLLGSRLGHTS